MKRLNWIGYWQKQLFTDVLQNRGYLKFRNIDRKIPVLDSSFIKVPDLKAYNLIKKRL